MSDRGQIIYGTHAVRHALDKDPIVILEAWMDTNKSGTRTLSPLLEALSRHGISVQRVEKKTLDNLTDGGKHQGIAIRRRGQVPLNDLTLDDLLSNNDLLVLILDGIQDPQNLGACLRTANAAGVNAVMIPKDRAVQVNATVHKVASGALAYTPVIAVTNLARSMDKLRDAGVWLIGASDDASAHIYDMDLKGSIGLVMGAEGTGLRHNTRKHCDRLVQIPMRGEVESLNVSVATGICLYEAVRQRM